MSWTWNPSGGVPRPPEPTEELMEDPTDPSREVKQKAANQPFLAYQQKQEREHQAWLLRRKERDEKLSRGEPEEVGLLGLLKFIVYLLLIIVLAGKFFTGSFLWEYDGKWVRLQTYLPENNGRLFSESYPATFDGRDENKPLYIAIDGDVYDVSSNRRTYGPGGPYRHMAGVDAAQYAISHTYLDLQSVRRWKRFFADHKTYFKVGRVIHPPIDPESPISEPWESSKAHAQPTENGLKRGKKLPGPKPLGPNRNREHAEL
ncbi:cytochrome b5 [Pisolithus albus]|nr:cytochrome b5 [Pisolithus albus]